MKRILWISVFTLFFLSCDNTPISQEFSQRIVVQAYLYAGEPVKDFFLTELLPYGSDEDSIQKISNAQVSIIYNGKEFLLSRGEDEGHYYYNDSNLIIKEGEQYQLKIQYDNVVASATTVVPAPPENLQISDSVLSFDMTPPVMGGDPGQRDTSEIEITWENDENSYFYVLIENIDSVQESFFDGTGFPGGNSGPGMFMRRITEPAQTDNYRIRSMELEYYGNFRAKIFRVNQEYADLYQSLDQDSRNLTEPASNITNGLGIFTAFNSDSIFFKVIHSE
jgi:hypothetical protein